VPLVPPRHSPMDNEWGSFAFPYKTKSKRGLTHPEGNVRLGHGRK
jgi:hypothetical protein